MEENAFEEGPCFTEEGQYDDPDYVVFQENPTIDVEVMEDLDQLIINPEMIPLIGDTFTVEPSEIDQELKIADFEAVIYA
jgi:hypothetical protein